MKAIIHRDKIISFILFVLFLLNILDGIFTILWTELQIAPEANPLMLLMLQVDPAWMMLSKITLVGGAIALLWKAKEETIAKFVVTVALFIYLFILIIHVGIFYTYINL